MRPTKKKHERNVAARWLLGFGLAALVLTGCSASSESEVATLSDQDAQPEASSSPTATDDGGLAFAACMRDNGIDVPDPDPDQGFGSPQDADIDFDDPKFRDALTECQDLLPGGNPLNQNFDSAQQEAILNLVACLRDNGVDVPDPQFDANGKLVLTDPGAINPGDPKLRKALEKCRSELGAVAIGPGAAN